MYIKTSKLLLVFSYNILGDNMEKKLPKVFANPLARNIDNNRRVYYGNQDRNIEVVTKKAPRENINLKINRIIKNLKYMYKVDVEITTQKGTKDYRLIGKNSSNLITLENELIPISDIIDIKEK